MDKNALTLALREFLKDKESVSNDSAPALKLMRHALVELEKPTSAGNDQEAVALRHELAAADREVARLNDVVSDRESFLYDLLADVGMVPEVDEEPVETLAAAIEIAPGLLSDLQSKVASMYVWADQYEATEDKDRFINGVRQLLEGGESLSLQGLWDALETKAGQFASLEDAVKARDELLVLADNRITAIRQKLGIPDNAQGPVEQLELANIDLIMQQRQAAQDRLLVGRDEAPAEGTLEDIIEKCLTVLRLDWQDVETLPHEVKQLHDEANRLLKDANFAVSGAVPLAGWVSDAIDLAHAVRGNMSPENRIMAKAAEHIIMAAPGVAK